jgi:hypothetical protein
MYGIAADAKRLGSSDRKILTKSADRVSKAGRLGVQQAGQEKPRSRNDDPWLEVNKSEDALVFQEHRSHPIADNFSGSVRTLANLPSTNKKILRPKTAYSPLTNRINSLGNWLWGCNASKLTCSIALGITGLAWSRLSYSLKLRPFRIGGTDMFMTAFEWRTAR